MMKVIGIDVGYGYTKVVTDVNGMILPLLSPSIVGVYEDGIVVDGLKTSERDGVTVNGQRFLIGESARRHASRLLDGRHEGWIDSIAYRALLMHALSTAACNAVNLTVVTGLPVNFYRTGKDKLINLVREIVEKYCLNLTVKVIPQPLGSFFNLLFDEAGRVADGDLASGKVGVLDVGFYTTDLITVSELELVERQIDSFENGVSTALTSIAKDIEAAYGLRPDIHKTEEAVKQGYIKAFGVQKDIGQAVEQRFGELARDIEGKAKTIWKNAADIDKVLLTGGGAKQLKGHLNLYRHAVVINDAQFANARGYYKFGRRLSDANGN